MLYVGFLSAKQYGRTNAAFRDYVYRQWDSSSGAPPTTRPQEEESLPPPDLQVLAWDADWPVWPEVLSTRFDAGTEECRRKPSLKQHIRPQIGEVVVEVLRADALVVCVILASTSCGPWTSTERCPRLQSRTQTFSLSVREGDAGDGLFWAELCWRCDTVDLWVLF